MPPLPLEVLEQRRLRCTTSKSSSLGEEEWFSLLRVAMGVSSLNNKSLVLFRLLPV